jgi:peptidoglycan/LPS O-acetylase OafA/YrhL
VTLAALPFGILTTHSVTSGALHFTMVQLVFGALVLTAFTHRGRWFTSPLRSRLAAVSGTFSYCIYLIHLCLVDLWWWVESTLHLRPAGVGYVAWGFVRTGIVASLAFAIAALSWRYLEGPALRLKQRFA